LNSPHADYACQVDRRRARLRDGCGDELDLVPRSATPWLAPIHQPWTWTLMSCYLSVARPSIMMKAARSRIILLDAFLIDALLIQH